MEEEAPKTSIEMTETFMMKLKKLSEKKDRLNVMKVHGTKER